MRYRRSIVRGGTFFFTVVLADRSTTLLTDHIDLLRQSFRTIRNRHPFEILAAVVLPDHLHTIWTLPATDNNYALRWSLIKSNFSRSLKISEPVNMSRILKRERGIWQRRFWEHQIRDDMDLNSYIDYIHFNPVKHDYVESPHAWPYSSIHRFIRDGILSKDWARDTRDLKSGEGE